MLEPGESPSIRPNSASRKPERGGRKDAEEVNTDEESLDRGVWLGVLSGAGRTRGLSLSDLIAGAVLEGLF